MREREGARGEAGGKRRAREEFGGVRAVLVMKFRHIGDVLLTVPTLRALRENFPGARISVLVNAGTEAVLAGNPLIDEVLVYERSVKEKGPVGRLRGELGLLGELRRRRFDMAVDLTGGDRPALLGLLCGARYRLGADPRGGGFAGKRFLYTHLAPYAGAMTHTVLRDLSVVRSFGLSTADLSVSIHPSRADEEAVEGLLKEGGVAPDEPFVHVHPTSRWFFKCWTNKGMADIMDRLQRAGVRAVVTAAPDATELSMVRSIKEQMGTRPVDLSGRLSLRQLAGLSRRAVVFFGVDTAPMHMAAAAGTPVVALFGPSGAFDWGPWDGGKASELAASPGAAFTTPYGSRSGNQGFGPHRVVQKPWECVPCGREGCERSGRSECLEGLTADEVWPVLEERVEAALRRL
ncbi:MAG TPA: putative lipopolysaccharide heptosyltransferase III [Deltaproteobacteria bacterium]|nr:putative lipopolysaccharide heptosyltransferase III [Deltaproteobacteria bacterium]